MDIRYALKDSKDKSKKSIHQIYRYITSRSKMVYRSNPVFGKIVKNFPAKIQDRCLRFQKSNDRVHEELIEFVISYHVSTIFQIH